jgi:hypothetical protein
MLLPYYTKFRNKHSFSSYKMLTFLFPTMILRENNQSYCDKMSASWNNGARINCSVLGNSLRNKYCSHGHAHNNRILCSGDFRAVHGEAIQRAQTRQRPSLFITDKPSSHQRGCYMTSTARVPLGGGDPLVVILRGIADKTINRQS